MYPQGVYVKKSVSSGVLPLRVVAPRCLGASRAVVARLPVLVCDPPPVPLIGAVGSITGAGVLRGP